MLGAVANYLFAWQLPLFGAFAAAWLAGGPYLTRWALGRFSDLPRTKRRMGKCAELNFFGTGLGLVGFTVVAGFFAVIGRQYNLLWLLAVGAAVALPVMLGMSWAAAAVILNLPARTLLRVAASTTGPFIALLAVTGAGAFIPAWYARQDQLRRDLCQRNLFELAYGLQTYALRGRPASDLQALVDEGIVGPERLSCPGKPDLAQGYLYVPVMPLRRDEKSDQILVCDRRGNHGGDRMVVFANGRLEVVDQDRFAELLERPENVDLKRLVAEER